MSYAAKYIPILIATSVTLCSVALKLYGDDQRGSGVTDVMSVRSLLECSWIFKSRKNSLSFNFKRCDNLCELSNNYPEGSAADEDGWALYAPVVNGAWTKWISGSCSVPCGGGTVKRTRTCTNPAPSNGGAPCSGDSTINAGCNGHSCIRSVGGYGASSNRVSWGTAKAKCEAEGERLVIINGQAEQDFLASQISVNGAWTKWISGSCSVPCGGGTVKRTRTCTNPAPSNGGAPCSGDSTINAGCNGHSCIRSIGGYGASSNRVSWGTAKAKCEAEGERLVIINGQAEQDFLASQISGLNHWIGMICASNDKETCTWIDGSSASAGFSLRDFSY